MDSRSEPARRTVVVLGSNSFTGGHLVDALLDRPGTAVVGMSRSPEASALFLPYRARRRPDFEFHRADLVREPDRLIGILDEIRPECIINVAALSEVNVSNFQPVEYFETNTLGVAILCNHLRTRPYLERYLHISTAEVYGHCTQPVPESAPVNPSTPYAASKAAADLYLLTLRRNFDFPVTLIRSTNVYGRHQQLYKIIPRTAIYLRLGRRIDLHGRGTAIRTFVHIRDLVDGVLRVLDHEAPAEIYHFSTDDDYPIAHVVGLVCTLLGQDPGVATVPVGSRVGHDGRYWLDWSRAARELAWSPRVPLEHGLKEVVTWVEANWDAIVREPHEYIHRV